jgi:molybdate transport system substrate-binding protein
MRLTLCLTLLLALMLPALGRAQMLTVSAAASLAPVLKVLAPRFEADQPGVTLRFNFAASGVLLQQLRQGAPVDVFASADQDTVTRGMAQKLLDGNTARDFARNSVVLVVPAQGGPALRTLADLTGPGVKRIAGGKVATVPVGRYAREALDASKLWPVLAPKWVDCDTVRQVLDYVERGEVEAGFVYRTDALSAADKVRMVLTVGDHTAVRYPVVVVSDSRQKALARDFIAFLTAPPAQDVLARYGFEKP